MRSHSCCVEMVRDYIAARLNEADGRRTDEERERSNQRAATVWFAMTDTERRKGLEIAAALGLPV